MRQTPVSGLLQCGQSVWLDGISRRTLLSGELVALIQEDEGGQWLARPYDSVMCNIELKGTAALQVGREGRG
ncbi:hypothetical protein [Geomonas agri]|uniref:hypothetical protein n=1 Tax=Geomonas agri TaxID=2873702 RepID=UPI001CD4626D|nr:hypothetical protein [Geomonas agri]